MENLISIVMPVRDGAEFLEACIQSIVAQPLIDFELELLVVDDHSSDNSYEIAQQLSDSHTWIRVLENRGKGILDALHTGKDAASGTWISRMDADDVMPSDKMRQLWEMLKVSGLNHSIATGKVKYFASGKEMGVGYLRYEAWLNNMIEKQNWKSQVYKECPIASPNWLMSVAVLDELGGFGSVYPEDYDLAFRMLYSPFKMVATTSVTHHWRDHDSRISRSSPVYEDYSFLELKTKWFLKEEYHPDIPLSLVGAGKKAKWMARKLIDLGIAFEWLTNNVEKIGKKIYGVELIGEAPSNLSCQRKYLVLVANPHEQDCLKTMFTSRKMTEGLHFYFFC